MGWAHLVREYVRHLSLDKTRQDDVHSDTKLAELFSSSFGESDDPRLAGSIVSLANVPSPRYNAGNVDDGSR